MELITDYMQSMDCISLAIFYGIIGVVFLLGIVLAAKCKNSKKAAPTKIRKRVSNLVDTGVTQHNSHGKSTHTVVKQSRYPSGNKQKRTKNKNAISVAKNNKDRMSLSESVVKNWLENDTYCYERNFTSSENLLSSQVIEQENSSSIVADGSENMNSCSSNENLSLTLSEKSNQSNKGTIPRQKKKQKRKNREQLNNKASVSRKSVGDTIKQNFKMNGTLTSSKNAVNLKKHCIKAAALKAALNSSQVSRISREEYSIMESFISDTASMASSSSSIAYNTSSVSSSASNSPAQSVNSSPTASPASKNFKRKSLLSQNIKQNMEFNTLAGKIKSYAIDPNHLRMYGFPVESMHYEDCVDIYKCLPKHLAEKAISRDNKRHHRHLYGSRNNNIINESDGLCINSTGQISLPSSLPDSGHISEESSPGFTDSDSSEVGDEDMILPLMAFYTPDGVYQIFSHYDNSQEKQCVRCSKMFEVNEKGEYLSFDTCTYHWGKQSKVYNGKCYTSMYSCCQGEEHSAGCSEYPLHVWNGIVVGLNGPYTGFLHTQKPRKSDQKYTKAFAIDCEMCYTGLGLELAKVSVVGIDGSLVYEHFVKPQAEIVDYNTRFSGVSANDFSPNSNRCIKTLSQVQKDLLNLFDSETVLIGHGLENDLKALRLVHKTIVDTSVIFSHSTGFPYRRSLKHLTKAYLKRDIQCGDMGHCSFEDAAACLELMMFRVRKDFLD